MKKYKNEKHIKQIKFSNANHLKNGKPTDHIGSEVLGVIYGLAFMQNL